MPFLISDFGFIALISSLCLPMTLWADGIDDLVAELGDESYKIRQNASRALIQRDVDRERLMKLASATTDPEIRMRLEGVIGVNGKLWKKLDKDGIRKLKPTGGENGESLYLARTEKDGSTFIGKYLLNWEGANFPIGETEVMVNDFTIWTGKGVWKPWQPSLKDMIAFGKNKDGKTVHACRAKFGNGIHQGTYIAGEDKAHIPWGGIVHRLAEFEILTADIE